MKKKKDSSISSIIWPLICLGVLLYALFHRDWFYLVAACVMAFDGQFTIVRYEGEE